MCKAESIEVCPHLRAHLRANGVSLVGLWRFFHDVGGLPGSNLFLGSWADRCNKNRNIGLLSEWGYADPSTNLYEWVANVSLQASGLVPGREADRMGAGWFYSGISSDLKNLASPISEVQHLTGVEMYYNAEVTSLVPSDNRRAGGGAILPRVRFDGIRAGDAREDQSIKTQDARLDWRRIGAIRDVDRSV